MSVVELTELLDGESIIAGNSGVSAWFFRNDRPEIEPKIRHWLTPDELARANRFRRSEDRCAYVLSRCSLRALLAQILETDPALVSFEQSPQGKPYLAGRPEFEGPFFNVSHTAGYTLIALSADVAVGVDIEGLDRRVESMELAERFFHPRELAHLQAVREERRREEFFRLWVRKESILKAWGVGISHGLSTHDLTGPSPGPQRILAPANLKSQSGVWCVLDLEPPMGYCAALAWKERE